MAEPVVGVVMGSDSDWETMQHAARRLEELGVPFECRVVSAHRTPDLLFRYAEEAAGRGMTVDPAHLISTTIDVGASADAFAAAWPQWQQAGVTAVVCATDTQAYGALQQARVAGVRIPADLAVAGFDDLPYSASSNPGLTSFHLPATSLVLKSL